MYNELDKTKFTTIEITISRDRTISILLGNVIFAIEKA